jgi:hypothetical protein
LSGSYKGEDIVLELPGDLSIFDIDWLSVWSSERDSNLGSVIIPGSLNIPPQISSYVNVDSPFPNCEQLHRRLQLHWEVFGPQVTFELIGQIDSDDYMSVGLAGPDPARPMDSADVAITYMEGQLGHVVDHNLTGRVPCTNVLGHHVGVCADTRLGAVENWQLNTFKRADGLTRISFRRNLKNNDPDDIEFHANETSRLIWAIGKLNKAKQPRMHHIYPKKAIELRLARMPPQQNCYSFSVGTFQSGKASGAFSASASRPSDRPRDPTAGSATQSVSSATNRKSWGPLRILNQTSTVFYARLGVAGGAEKGYSSLTGNTQHSPGLVWYVHQIKPNSLNPNMILNNDFGMNIHIAGTLTV